MCNFQELYVILQEKHVCTLENMIIYRDHTVSTGTWAWGRGQGRWEELCQCVNHISELLQGTFRDCQGGCEGHCGACQLEGDTESQASSDSSERDKTDNVTGEPSQTGRSRGQVLG